MSGNQNLLENKNVLITGGTGSLGKILVRRLLSGEIGMPRKIVIFSRDEAKQHHMRIEYQNSALLEFRIGDVRNFHSVCSALRDADIVINAAALKQVPSCEYFPYEAVETNISGPENIVRAIKENKFPIETVLGVSTDKACKPVNVMGMTKALQERLFICANLSCPDTRFVCIRYGNVLASRGSVIPLFHEQIRNGGPVTITTVEMTRFMLSLNQAVDTAFMALREARRGEMYIPSVPSARMLDVACALIGDRNIETVVTGIRPGEKIHEILVSEEECFRTIKRGDYYIILPILPELRDSSSFSPVLRDEYSSANDVLSTLEIQNLLLKNNLLVEDNLINGEEMLR